MRAIPINRTAPQPLPKASARQTVTIVVPTLREAENITPLARRLEAVRNASAYEIDLLIVDDDSRDGTDAVVEELRLPWVRLLTRRATPGLSAAVLDGINATRSELIVVMDADQSHPPEKIHALLESLENGAEIAVGSRFTEGGTTADDWGPFRWLNSRVATALALPLTRIKDPMSGFFAIRRRTLEAGSQLNPIGYKILLEILVKCRCRLVVEVPIHFDNRRYGASKLSVTEQIRYFQHLRRLYTFRFGTWSHLLQFLVVGATGLAVNLLVLTLLLKIGVERYPAVAGGIAVSLLWNFMLNRRFAFSYARDRPFTPQLLAFVAACSVGAAVNFLTTIKLAGLMTSTQLAAVAGVAAGTAFNFAASRFLVFRAMHVKH